jgi:YHS domain-containing protein
MAKDPVCGMQIDERKPAGKSEYRGKTYSFCPLGCKASFDKEPEKYANVNEKGSEHRHEDGTRAAGFDSNCAASSKKRDWAAMKASLLTLEMKRIRTLHVDTRRPPVARTCLCHPLLTST